MKRQQGFTLIELLIVIAIIVTIAAIAMPGLSRARVSANEAAMLGDVRAVLAAALAYESASNGNGFPASFDCLSAPNTAACLGTAYTGPTFLDAGMTAAVGPRPKQGYLRVYTPDTANPVGVGTNAGVAGYCYGGTPQAKGRTGVKAFGGDNSGLVGASADGSPCCSAPTLAEACAPAR